MLKAMMIITMVSGATYEVKLPSMEQCMAQKTPVESQNDVTSAACIPRTDDRMPAEIFSQFMDMFMVLSDQKEGCMENYYPPEQ
tara:strand:+ start:491 stop:742 length:252 start_codon:yes stop_codon:yes gene_type:complete